MIHPTNNSDIDIGLPVNIYIKDVFSQLIDANFLSPAQQYSGVVLSKEANGNFIPLDNEKQFLKPPGAYFCAAGKAR